MSKTVKKKGGGDMAYDVKCPYCGVEQFINHDDGYRYEEEVSYSQKCECGKEFYFSPYIEYKYEVFCKPGDHEFVRRVEGMPVFDCKRCGYYVFKNL